LIAIAVAVVLITGAVVAYFTLWSGKDTSGAAPTETASNTGFPTIDGTGAAAGGALPDPLIGVLDRNAILSGSKVGQDILRQMQALTNQARDRLSGERRWLENEGGTLQTAENMPEAERAKRIAALQSREARFMQTSAREENILKASMAAAHNEVAKVMGPILEALTKQQGINMVLDRSAVPIAVPGPEFDLTPAVLKELDAKMPTYQVKLVQPGQQAAP
jgi:Skp family chaperone for outer membrane proteins